MAPAGVTREDIGGWRAAVLRSVLPAAGALAGLVGVTTYVMAGAVTAISYVAYACVVLPAIAWRVPPRHYRWRVALLTAGLYGMATAAFLRLGPLPGPALTAALSILVVVVFCGKRAGGAMLLLVTLTVVGAGWLVTRGWLDAPYRGRRTTSPPGLAPLRSSHSLRES